MEYKYKILIIMILYMSAVIGIGIYFFKRAQKNSENYFLGGRTLGPWVTAMSAEASDMSGWLLMGLPGLAYWCGLSSVFWTAVGLAIGTYVNWLIVAKRLRNYSQIAGNSITVPDFFSNRFKEKNKVILGISAVFIFVFFAVYASSCFATVGKLFTALFGGNYHIWLLVGAVFVVAYTLIGGFLAESVSDFMQAVVMIAALVIVVIIGVVKAGGVGEVIENAKNIDGYLSLFETATPEAGGAFFGQPEKFGFWSIVSELAWGLGYFGVPQVLLRFMAIRKPSEIKQSRIIATIWVVISLACAVIIGIVGRAYLGYTPELGSKSLAENILIVFSEKVFQNSLWIILAGIIMAGILAATISSSDSYLLIASSAVSANIFKGIIKKDKVSDKTVMWVSRISVIVIAIAGMIIAWNEDSVIFNLVSFAWAGFGATFGPLMLFSLFWKRTTRAGAIAGMLSGGLTVFVWEFLFSRVIAENTEIAFFGIYELLPAFVVSSIVIVVVSLLTKKPDKEIEDEFERAKRGEIDEAEVAPEATVEA